MNTIPLTFNERQISRAVFGGTRNHEDSWLPFSVIVLNQGNRRYLSRCLENLTQCGFDSIVVVERSDKNFSTELLSQQFPSVVFIIPQEPVTIGDCVNIGMEKIHSSHVLVLQDTVHFSPTMISERMAERIMQMDKLCVCPLLQSSSHQNLPVKMFPYIEKNVLSFSPEMAVSEGSPTAYPFDYIGVYDRRKFIALGGYDYTITSPYWQNLDFSMRAWLRGEAFVIMPSFRIGYEEELSPEDMTVDESHFRFFLKNLAPRFKNGYAYIPISSFFSYLRRSSHGMLNSRREFSDARCWVKKNRFTFKTDIVSLIKNWETAAK